METPTRDINKPVEPMKPEPVSAACERCPLAVQRFGIDLEKWDYIIALAGNPNTGKSTIFNALTGLRQHTGNWPGKTVARAEGGFGYQDRKYKIVDLPGTYSLLSASVDEEIARDFILFGKPDCTLVVVDSTCLERNLNLVLQVMEITDKVIVVANLMDEARRRGIEVNYRRLAENLGVPVIPAAAAKGEGISEILKTIHEMVTGAIKTTPHRTQNEGPLKEAIEELTSMIEKAYPGIPNARWIAMRLLDGDQKVRETVKNGELTQFSQGKVNTVEHVELDV
jgi:ferrous iron transport protein B